MARVLWDEEMAKLQDGKNTRQEVEMTRWGNGEMARILRRMARIGGETNKW